VSERGAPGASADARGEGGQAAGQEGRPVAVAHHHPVAALVHVHRRGVNATHLLASWRRWDGGKREGRQVGCVEGPGWVSPILSSSVPSFCPDVFYLGTVFCPPPTHTGEERVGGGFGRLVGGRPEQWWGPTSEASCAGCTLRGCPAIRRGMGYLTILWRGADDWKNRIGPGWGNHWSQFSPF